MSEPIGIAVDGGNSKTHLALVRRDGAVLALVAGPGSSPHRIGLDGCLDVLGEMLGQAVRQAEVASSDGALAEVGRVLLAGADLPAEEDALQEALSARRWAGRMKVANDTFGVLRAGSDRGWGVAVVCGAGVNCVGVAPDGRETRFPALGLITGDWGGGDDVGPAGLAVAARGADGRGQPTSLQSVIPAHFGFETPQELAEAIHLGRIAADRLVEVAPIVLAEAESDAVAREIVARLASEIVAFARVALTRLDLLDRPVEVLLGGGLIRSGRGGLVPAVAGELAEVAPSAELRTVEVAPVVGAALLALDALGADEAARARLRDEMAAAELPLVSAPVGGADV
jgi:N-acetylglucosamine kinase-like BadF-type ATPase